MLSRAAAGAAAAAATAAEAGDGASSSELEGGAEDAAAATAATAAAAVAAPRRPEWRRGVAGRDSGSGPRWSGRGGVGAAVVDWALAQDKRSFRRAPRRRAVASSVSQNGRCSWLRTPGRPVYAERSCGVRRP
jgi:hypothetical protein